MLSQIKRSGDKDISPTTTFGIHKRSKTDNKMDTRVFSLLRKNVQPLGRPDAAATRPAFKSKGKYAAVWFGHFLGNQKAIKFDRKIHDLFSAKF